MLEIRPDVEVEIGLKEATKAWIDAAMIYSEAMIKEGLELEDAAKAWMEQIPRYRNTERKELREAVKPSYESKMQMDAVEQRERKEAAIAWLDEVVSTKKRLNDLEFFMQEDDLIAEMMQDTKDDKVQLFDMDELCKVTGIIPRVKPFRGGEYSYKWFIYKGIEFYALSGKSDHGNE